MAEETEKLRPTEAVKAVRTRAWDIIKKLYNSRVGGKAFGSVLLTRKEDILSKMDFEGVGNITGEVYDNLTKTLNGEKGLAVSDEVGSVDDLETQANAVKKMDDANAVWLKFLLYDGLLNDGFELIEALERNDRRARERDKLIERLKDMQEDYVFLLFRIEELENG